MTAPLEDAYGSLRGRAHERRTGGRHRDAAALATLDHVTHRGTQGEEDAVEVDAQHLVPVLGREVDEPLAVPADAGVREARVDLPERLDGRRERCFDLPLVAHVALQGQHLRAVLRELLGRRRVLVLVGAPDGHVSALRRKTLSHPEPDAAVAAGHESHVAGQVEECSHGRRPYPAPHPEPHGAIRSFACAGLRSVVHLADCF